MDRDIFYYPTLHIFHTNYARSKHPKTTMKLLAATALISASGASAFAPSSSAGRLINAPRMSETAVEAPIAVEFEEPFPPPPALPEMSASIPFLSRPAALDGSLDADVGFDPFGFAKSREDLMNYREAEVKHARLAMLAAAGWPLSEIFDKKIAMALSLPAVVDAADRAPSLLNGGLGKVSPVYWVGCLALAAAVDSYGIMRSKSGDYRGAGDLGFDPLGVFPKGEDGQKWMQAAEIKNGRLAMIAITAFAVQEAVSHMGVVNETPLFFFPLIQTLKEYANAGYIN